MEEQRQEQTSNKIRQKAGQEMEKRKQNGQKYGDKIDRKRQ